MDTAKVFYGIRHIRDATAQATLFAGSTAPNASLTQQPAYVFIVSAYGWALVASLAKYLIVAPLRIVGKWTQRFSRLTT